MRISLIAAVLAALVLPVLAAAKEPTRASISGPGFHKILTMREGPDYSSSAIGRLTETSGFFPSAVGQSPDPMLRARPTGPLGPRYLIVWTVPAGATHRIAQDIYPYARGGAFAYMRPGQAIFDSTTIGGWYRNPELKRTLVSLGLPVSAPSDGSGFDYVLIFGLAAAGLLGAAALLLVRRQRGQRSPSTSSTELPAGSRT
jgi:MYXO-CTERM domain-containing protein